jgi:hypothetical protein
VRILSPPAVLLALSLAAGCGSLLGTDFDRPPFPAEAGLPGSLSDGQAASEDGVGNTNDAQTETGVCAPAATQCSSGSVETCNANGQWGSPVACPYGCSGDVCTSASDDAGACAMQTVDDAKGLFVLSSGADSPSCGARGMECQTIQYAIDRAASSVGVKSIVYVGSSLTAYVEALTLKAGITVEGGWFATGTMWTPICSASRASAVAVQAPSGVGTTVSANDLGGPATLRDVTIQSDSQTPVAGESVYGIFASGASTALTLDDVAAATGKAGDGADGTPGAQGASGAAGGCPAGDGASGAVPGPSGVAGSPGAFAQSGYVLSAGGGGGGGGAIGDNGPGGAPGNCQTCLNCVTDPSCETFCGTECYCVSQPTGQTECGEPGQGGCAGAGGAGGTGGGGGGSSIVLFVWDAQVVVLGGSLAAGNGGNGGSGGDGGGGGVGATGEIGGNGIACIDFCACSENECNAFAFPPTGGAAGGTGGDGSAGGQGGGGAGGDSYAVYVGGAGSALVDKSTALAAGMPGAGGAVGGPPGQAANRSP